MAGKKAVDVGEDVVWFDEQLCAAATVELGWPDDWRETFANDEVVVLCEVLMPEIDVSAPAFALLRLLAVARLDFQTKSKIDENRKE